MPPGKKKKNGRGGARPGAGRTKGPPTIYHGLRLPPEVSRWIKNIVKAWNKTNPDKPKMTVSRLVTQIIEAEIKRRQGLS
jgi:hypothetical protein